jgi:hypothetical protein
MIRGLELIVWPLVRAADRMNYLPPCYNPSKPQFFAFSFKEILASFSSHHSSIPLTLPKLVNPLQPFQTILFLILTR